MRLAVLPTAEPLYEPHSCIRCRPSVGGNSLSDRRAPVIAFRPVQSPAKVSLFRSVHGSHAMILMTRLPIHTSFTAPISPDTMYRAAAVEQAAVEHISGPCPASAASTALIPTAVTCWYVIPARGFIENRHQQRFSARATSDPAVVKGSVGRLLRLWPQATTTA